MEASRATPRLRSGASSSQLLGRRLAISSRKRAVASGPLRRVVVAAARGRDGGWVTRGTRVLAFAFRKARHARRAEGIQNVLAKALGGACPRLARE